MIYSTTTNVGENFELKPAVSLILVMGRTEDSVMSAKSLKGRKVPRKKYIGKAATKNIAVIYRNVSRSL